MAKTLEQRVLEHQRLDWQRERIKHAEEAWLRRSGWTYTSSTPGCYWMWVKEIDGRTYVMHQETAARIQAHFDGEEDYRLHPEDYEE